MANGTSRLKEIDSLIGWTETKKAWFMSLIEGMVTDPNTANLLHHRGRFDLELEIVVAPEDRHLFTPEVCTALQTIVATACEVLSPVIYLEGNPHPDAKEKMYQADCEV